jgi:hypothetical protein
MFVLRQMVEFLAARHLVKDDWPVAKAVVSRGLSLPTGRLVNVGARNRVGQLA